MGNERWRQKKLCQYSCYQVGCGYDGDVCVTCCARGEAQPSAGFSPLGFHMPLLIPSEGKQAAPLQGLCAILSLVFFWLHCYTCSVISRGFTFFCWSSASQSSLGPLPRGLPCCCCGGTQGFCQVAQRMFDSGCKDMNNLRKQK